MLLLDANVIIWWMSADQRLGMTTRQLLEAPDTELTLSLLSLFEIEMKLKTNKLKLPGLVDEFLDKSTIITYKPSARELSDIMSVDLDHTDPFDCALVGLGKLKGWSVVTSDKILLRLAAHLVTLIDSGK